MEQTSNARDHLLEESTDRCSLTPDSLTLLLISHPPPSIPQVFTNPRFLVLAFAMEQTSNARAHLLEAARLARLTGRVLVLPHVGSGRLSWVSPDLFLLLARSSLPAAPSVGFVCVETPSLNRPCFDFGEVASGLGAILTYSLGQLPTRANTQVITVRKASRFLTAFQKWQHTDVVVWVKTTYKRMAIRPPTSLLVPVLLPYHPRWHTLARSIASALPHPFIALHLRSEYIAWLVCSLSHPFIALHFRSKYMAWLEGGKLQQEQKIGKQMHWEAAAGAEDRQADALGGKLQQEQKIGKQMHWCVAEAARTVHQVQQQLSNHTDGALAKGKNASAGDSPSHYSIASSPERLNEASGPTWHSLSSSPSVFISADIAFGAAAAAAAPADAAPADAAPADAAPAAAAPASGAAAAAIPDTSFPSRETEQKADEEWPVRSDSWGVMVEKYGREQTTDAASDASQNSSGFDTASTAEEVWPVRSESWGVMVEKYGREQTIDAGHRALLQLRALVDGDGDDYKGDGGIGAAPPPAASPTGGAPSSRLRGGGAVPKPNAPSITSANSTVKPTGFKPTGPEPTGNKTNGGNPSGAGPKPTGTKPNSGSPSLTKPVENNKSTVNSTNKKSPAKPADKTADKTAAKPPGATAPSAKKTVTVQSSAIESQRQRMVGARISAAGEAGSASWLVQNGGATCDISVGTWIPSSTRPAYASTCPYISSKFNCVQNGRPDGGYQHLMWQPRDCNMTLFSPLHFALMFQDKTLALVGDSNAEYLFQSLRCQLSTGLETESVNTTTAGAEAFRVISSNTLVLLVDAPFLSYAAPVAPRGISALVLLVGAPFLSYAAPVMPVLTFALVLLVDAPFLSYAAPVATTLQFKSSAWNVHLDVLHPTLRQILPDAHAVIFSSGSWFMPPGRSYYKNGRPLAAQINGLQAHSAVLGVLSDYLAQLSPTGIQQLLLGLGKVVGAGAVGDVCWQVPGSAQTIAGYF
ncbi:unnamed protein product [Closterium sp. NIES-64]|nr:unnamed protein product [Closterium sp. NIES-64]